jgi:hypothetical protein
LSQGKYLDSATIENGLFYPLSTAWHEYTTEKHDNLYPIQKRRNKLKKTALEWLIDASGLCGI